MVESVLIPDAMTRFRCNQKGCCCQGWSIQFKHDCLVRLLRHFEPREREGIIEGMDVMLDPDTGEVTSYRLRSVGERGQCQFLAQDGRCGVHAKHGVGALPTLCKAFPAIGQRGPEGVEMHYDAVCPEVLNQLDERDEPLHLVRVELDEETALGVDLIERAQLMMGLPPAKVGPHALDHTELVELRAKILQALEEAFESGATFLQVLGWLNYAMAVVAQGEECDLSTFAFPIEESVEPFMFYFKRCMALHEPLVLRQMFESYARFVHAIDLPPDTPEDWGRFAALLQLPDNWDILLDLDDPAFRSLVIRFISYRVYSAFDRTYSGHQVSFNYGSITHTVATAMRYAVALALWTGRSTVDRATVKVALGAGEYFYRTVRIPSAAMPWFGLSSTLGQEGDDV